MKRSISIAFVIAISAILTVPAQALAPAPVMQDFGLIGNWSNNACQPDSWFAFYAASGDQAQLTYKIPGQPDSVYEIVDASTTDNSILLQEKAASNQAIFEIGIVKQNGQIRIWSSQSNGTVYVKDGMSMTQNIPTQWFVRCN